MDLYSYYLEFTQGREGRPGNLPVVEIPSFSRGQRAGTPAESDIVDLSLRAWGWGGFIPLHFSSFRRKLLRKTQGTEPKQSVGWMSSGQQHDMGVRLAFRGGRVNSHAT